VWNKGVKLCSSDENRRTAELPNVKNGILRPQWLHPGSMCLEGGWSRWLKGAQREARCNQASKMRMTTSTLVDWGCLAASLSAGHHQERLLGQPLWPYCGFKFPFEGGFVSSYFLTKQLIHKVPGQSLEGSVWLLIIFKEQSKRLIYFKCPFKECHARLLRQKLAALNRHK